LRKTSAICTLSNANGVSGSGIGKGTGYVYVPSALIETYKTATNWSTFANQFRALEDYTVDGTVSGELDESKI
jgi:tRNA A37 threonylcarbamoyladenosine synthetase subunit TsaC/SUA5/YrdC